MKNFTFHESKQISLNKINGNEISTVLLPRFGNEPKQWETCMFYADGNSDVVCRYATEEEAINGHNRIVEHELMHKWARDNAESKSKFAEENTDFATYLEFVKLERNC